MPFQVKHFAPRERGTRLHSHRVLLSLSLSLCRSSTPRRERDLFVPKYFRAFVRNDDKTRDRRLA